MAAQGSSGRSVSRALDGRGPSLAFSWAAALAIACSSYLPLAMAQNVDGEDSVLSGKSTIVAFVVVGALCVFSAVLATLGIVVAVQYPLPHCLCWTTPYSDQAGQSGACCSLYRSNMGLLILWAMFMIIMAVTRSFLRTAVCVGFLAVHMLASYLLRKAYMEHGFPSWADQNSSSVLPDEPQSAGVWNDALPAPQPASLAGRQQQQQQQQGGAFSRGSALSSRNGNGNVTVGMPVYAIPLCRAEVWGPPAPATYSSSDTWVVGSATGPGAKGAQPQGEGAGDGASGGGGGAEQAALAGDASCQCRTCLMFEWLQRMEAEEGGVAALNPIGLFGGDNHHHHVGDGSAGSVGAARPPGQQLQPSTQQQQQQQQQVPGRPNNAADCALSSSVSAGAPSADAANSTGAHQVLEMSRSVPVRAGASASTATAASRRQAQAALIAALPLFPQLPSQASSRQDEQQQQQDSAVPVLAHPVPEPLLVVDGTPVGADEGGAPARLRRTRPGTGLSGSGSGSGRMVGGVGGLGGGSSTNLTGGRGATLGRDAQEDDSGALLAAAAAAAGSRPGSRVMPSLPVGRVVSGSAAGGAHSGPPVARAAGGLAAAAEGGGRGGGDVEGGGQQWDSQGLVEARINSRRRQGGGGSGQWRGRPPLL